MKVVYAKSGMNRSIRTHSDPFEAWQVEATGLTGGVPW